MNKKKLFNSFFYYVCFKNEFIKGTHCLIKMKSFFRFGLRRIKKSTPKAALGIGNRILRLTSENYITALRALEEKAFVPYTINIIRV